MGSKSSEVGEDIRRVWTGLGCTGITNDLCELSGLLRGGRFLHKRSEVSVGASLVGKLHIVNSPSCASSPPTINMI